jgi:hypothetical protein
MDRRDFLKLTSLSGLGIIGARLFTPIKSLAQALDSNHPLYMGWVDDPAAREIWMEENDSPYLNKFDEEIRGTGSGKIALLFPFLEKLQNRSFISHVQDTGDCVSHGFGLGVDLLTAIQIVKRDSPQRWVAEAATEVIYGGSRIQISKEVHGMRMPGEGSLGLHTGEFVKKYGILLRQKYLTYDFTKYSGTMADRLGRSGLPKELQLLCKVHPVGCAAVVNSYEEVRDCIYNGYPVPICSNQGFSTKRDQEGFLSPRGSWNHCMCIIGIDDNPKRPGCLIQNSWPLSWVSGPKRLGMPDGSFWADASVIDRMAKQGDTVAISAYAGYPKLDYSIF